MTRISGPTSSFSTEKQKLLELVLAKRGIGAPRLNKIDRRAIHSPCGLSFGQEQIWSLAGAPGADTAHLVHHAFRLEGPLDPAVLQKALDGVVARHEVLRTTFARAEGGPQQIIWPESRFVLDVDEIADKAPEQQEETVRASMAGEVGTPFNLETSPMIRGRLIRQSALRQILLITTHRIVYDGWSRAVLARDLGDLYEAELRGESNLQPDLPIQYGDYSLWHRRLLAGDAMERGIDYWKRQLDGATPFIALPTDHPRPDAMNISSARVAAISFSEDLSAALKLLARKQDTTLYTVLCAGWALLVWVLSGQNDIVIGVPVANRQHTQLESLIGNFVNHLPLRVRLNEDLSVGALLGQVKETMFDAYAHREVPFTRMAAALRRQDTLNHRTLYQIMFNLINVPPSVPHLPGITVTPLDTVPTKAEVDLSIIMKDSGPTVIGGLIYAADLFDPGTIDEWVRRFRDILTGMVTDSPRKIGDLRD